MSKRELLLYTPNTLGYAIAAIHTSMEPHQIAWLINNLCNTFFWRNSENLNIPVNKTESEFIYFRYLSPLSDIPYSLILNIGSFGSLINSKPKPDYLLVSKADEANEQINQWIDLIAKSPNITTAYMLDSALIQKQKWLIWLNE